MDEPTKCQCRIVYDDTYPDMDNGEIVQCERCKKRDDLWDELVGMLKWHSAAWKDESYDGMAEDTDTLLARCGDAT